MTSPPSPPYTEATVELVARAIAEGNSQDPLFTSPRWADDRYEGARDRYREQARSALNAVDYSDAADLRDIAAILLAHLALWCTGERQAVDNPVDARALS